MGCTQGKGAPDASRLPNEDVLVKNANAIVKSAANEAQSIKLLLIGAGSSGKTTFRKQLRNIFVGFTDQQRMETAEIVLENLWQGTRTLATCFVKELVPELKNGDRVPSSRGIPLANEIDYILHGRSEGEHALDDASVKTLLTFWRAPEVQEFLQKRPPKLMLQECVLEFAKELAQYPQWGGPKWIPSANDCIRARVRSSGVAEEQFVIDGQTFRLFDAGGQRSERRKWIHYFDNVSSVIFMTSLTAYAENIFEDSSQNGLVESLDLFDSMANSKAFRNTPMMLFFNKSDLLEEYLVKLRIPLNRSGLFPDAPEGFDMKEAIEWQMTKFKQRKHADPSAGPLDSGDSNIYCHVTSAVSKDNVDKVFATCRTIILKESLKRSGFVAS